MLIVKFLQSLGLLSVLYLTHGKPVAASPVIFPHCGNDNASTDALAALPRRETGPKPKDYRHYTAIGDGYAAGTGLGFKPFDNDNDARCRRRQESYAYQLVTLIGDKLGIQSFNIPACIDDGPEQVKKQIDNGDSSVSPLPHVWHDFGQPDLVTIHAGLYERDAGDEGQDSAFHQLIYNCYTGSLIEEPGCQAAMLKAQELFVTNQARYEDLYFTALTFNLAEGQSRDVYVLSYPLWYRGDTGGAALCPVHEDKVPWPEFDPDGPDGTALGPDGTGLGPGDTKQVSSMMNNIVAQLNAKIRRAVDAVNMKKDDLPGAVHFVDVDAAFADHRVCDKELPYFNEQAGSDLLLPTEAGHLAIAQALSVAITG